MLAIMAAESGCDPTAIGDKTLVYSDNDREYGYSVGLMQIRMLPGREYCDTLDVTINLKCAYNIWKGQGYNAWTQYSNGEYKKYL